MLTPCHKRSKALLRSTTPELKNSLSDVFVDSVEPEMANSLNPEIVEPETADSLEPEIDEPETAKNLDDSFMAAFTTLNMASAEVMACYKWKIAFLAISSLWALLFT
jgi:hypothetical protein